MKTASIVVGVLAALALAGVAVMRLDASYRAGRVPSDVERLPLHTWAHVDRDRSIGCATSEGLDRLADIVESGDTAAFGLAETALRCGPLMRGERVVVEEHRPPYVRVRREGDVESRWLLSNTIR